MAGQADQRTSGVCKKLGIPYDRANALTVEYQEDTIRRIIEKFREADLE